jgi:hypothetical protein
MANSICYSRPDRYEPTTIRCAVCNLAWDIDDPAAPSCPKQVASPPTAPMTKQEIRNHVEGRLEFATGLPFVDNQHKR